MGSITLLRGSCGWEREHPSGMGNCRSHKPPLTVLHATSELGWGWGTLSFSPPRRFKAPLREVVAGAWQTRPPQIPQLLPPRLPHRQAGSLAVSSPAGFPHFFQSPPGSLRCSSNICSFVIAEARPDKGLLSLPSGLWTSQKLALLWVPYWPPASRKSVDTQRQLGTGYSVMIQEIVTAAQLLVVLYSNTGINLIPRHVFVFVTIQDKD